MLYYDFKPGYPRHIKLIKVPDYRYRDFIIQKEDAIIYADELRKKLQEYEDMDIFDWLSNSFKLTIEEIAESDLGDDQLITFS